MRLYDYAFWIALFFLCGAFLGNIIPHQAILIIFFFICIFFACLFLKNKSFAFSSVAFLFGFVYVLWYASFAFQTNIPFEKKINAEGLIVHVAIRENSQALTLKLFSPFFGRVQVVTSRYPEFRYGETIALDGIIQKPEGDFAGYYRVNRISGISVFPKIEHVGSGGGFFIFRLLFGFQERFLDGLRQTLPSDEASFAGGLIVGNRSSPVSQSLREDFQKSGTSHLVALSGYNITIIIKSLMMALGMFAFTRKFRFAIALCSVAFFVVMVGAQASIVRAAVMGVIVLLASYSERVYSARNAIALTAFYMALWNPFVLAYDIGFQLSFVALLGILYLKPAIERLFCLSRDAGLLSWKEHAMTTISAQLAVAPLLIFYFENFSLAGFFTNILILFAIPMTMLFAFLTGALGLVSFFLAMFPAAILHLLLAYEIGIIQLFASIEILQYRGGNGIGFVILYYVIASFFVFWMLKKKSYETIKT